MGSQADKPAAPVVQIEKVSLLRDGREILKDISLAVNRGEHWVLVGPNGSGKTSLLNLVNAYLWPSRGRVTVLGERYGRVDVRDMRRRIGFVTSALYERVPSAETCREVVLSGRFASLGLYEKSSAEDRRKAAARLKFLGLSSVADSRYGVLSFGERQRALIARALAADQELLVLDEPFEGLDLGAREIIIRLLDRLAGDSGGPTLLLVTHRIEEIPAGITHAAIIKDGRIMAAGPRDSVLTGENLSRAMDTKVEVVRKNGRLAALVG